MRGGADAVSPALQSATDERIASVRKGTLRGGEGRRDTPSGDASYALGSEDRPKQPKFF